MKLLLLFLMVLFMGSCATRRVWVPDNPSGYVWVRENGHPQKIKYSITSIGKDISFSVEICEDQSFIILKGDFKSGLSEKIEIVEVRKSISANREERWDFDVLDNKRLFVLSDVKVTLDESVKNLNSQNYCRYIVITEKYEGKYKTEKIIGRTLVTPLAVGVDVIVVATAIIWYPLLMVMSSDLKNIN